MYFRVICGASSFSVTLLPSGMDPNLSLIPKSLVLEPSYRYEQFIKMCHAGIQTHGHTGSNLAYPVPSYMFLGACNKWNKGLLKCILIMLLTSVFYCSPSNTTVSRSFVEDSWENNTNCMCDFNCSPLQLVFDKLSLSFWLGVGVRNPKNSTAHLGEHTIHGPHNNSISGSKPGTLAVQQHYATVPPSLRHVCM